MPDPIVPPAPANPAAEPEKKKFKRAKNDQRIAAEITAAHRFLQTVAEDTDIQPIATTHGIDAAELADATAKVVTAGKKWGVRLEGISGEDTLVEATDAEFLAIKEAYLVYRQIGRANFPAAADRTALGLSGDIPDGFDTYATHVKAAYETGKKAPYTELLTKRNYSPARLDTLIAAIEDLVEDETNQTEAEGDAMKRTEERNQAYEEMKAALRPIKGTLRNNPHCWQSWGYNSQISYEN